MTDMAPTQIEPGKRRINFSEPTRKLLQAAAGQRCCYRTCLRLTSGISGKHKDKSARGIGVAAHVYSAAEYGPRGRSELTPEQVRSESNGLWMCALHGRQVDDFQHDYPAEDLLRMKAVRELAHSLEQKDDDVGSYVKYVGVREWNECVWEHVVAMPVAQITSVDPAAIISAFRSVAVQQLAVIDQFMITLQPKLPAHLAVKPVAAAAAALVRPVAKTAGTFLIGMNDTPSRTTLFAHERTRVLAIITALSDAPRRESPGENAFVTAGTVLLTVIDPNTGDWYEGGVWQNADISGGLSYSLESGERVWLSIKRTSDLSSALCWRLEAELNAGVFQLDNVLERHYLSIPYMRPPMTRVEFDRYRDLLAKIVAGWKPIAFVSLLSDDHGWEDRSSLHPLPFEPRLAISAAALAELERDCDKIAAGMDVASKWGEYWKAAGSLPVAFDFNDLFFADYIDRDLLWYACDALIARRLLNPNSYTWRTEPLIMTSATTGIVFQCRGRSMAFENCFYWNQAAISGMRLS